jgi:CubicO group peptidase (beta-lactamase class C family)
VIEPDEYRPAHRRAEGGERRVLRRREWLGIRIWRDHPADDLAAVPGRFGWTGGTGTCVYTDPAEELIGILPTQRYMTSPMPPPVFRDFWTCAYQAIDD